MGRGKARRSLELIEAQASGRVRPKGTSGTRQTDEARNTSPSMNSEGAYVKPLQRQCYPCRKPLGAQVFSVDIYDARAYFMGRHLVCLDCVSRTPHGPRAARLTCVVCAQRFTRFYAGLSPGAALNGLRREVTSVCSAACAAARRQRRRPRFVELRSCAACHESFAGRADATFCSVRCRVRAHRRRTAS
jgi:hypothetical protein